REPSSRPCWRSSVQLLAALATCYAKVELTERRRLPTRLEEPDRISLSLSRQRRWSFATLARPHRRHCNAVVKALAHASIRPLVISPLVSQRSRAKSARSPRRRVSS